MLGPNFIKSQLERTDLPKNAIAKMQIAADILSRLAVFKIAGGVYCNAGYSTVLKTPTGEVLDEPANPYAEELIKTCEVCAKGAILLASLLRREDTITCRRLTDSEGRITLKDSDILSLMEPMYTRYELDQIESVFEGWSGSSYGFYCGGSKINRITKIFENVIRNDGTFKALLEAEQTR